MDVPAYQTRDGSTDWLPVAALTELERKYTVSVDLPGLEPDEMPLESQNTCLQEEVVEAKGFGDLIGQSAALRRMVCQIELVAPTEAVVLILGETGTGKELVAHEVHRRSTRKDLDVRMPRMGGLELQRLLAARNHRISIIFITANGGEDVSAKALQAGAVEFLHKPFSQESLLRAVRSALAASRKDTT